MSYFPPYRSAGQRQRIPGAGKSAVSGGLDPWTMPPRHPPVVIIGAGVGGLTLALLLRQRGIAAEVLEQSAELHEVGAAVGLAANATRVLQRLGLGDGLAQNLGRTDPAHSSRWPRRPPDRCHRGQPVVPGYVWRAFFRPAPDRVAAVARGRVRT